MFKQDQHTWLAKVLKTSKPGQAAPGGPAPGGPPPAAGSPMLPDCRIVHGKVPGPKDHVLCATHGHVLDSTKKLIIAADLKDYAARFSHPAAHAPSAPAPPPAAAPPAAVPQPAPHPAPTGPGPVATMAQGMNTAADALGTVLGQGATALATPDPAAKDRMAQIETGKSLAANTARDFVMAKYSRVTNAMVRWQNDQTKLLRKDALPESGLGETLKKLTKVLDMAVLVIFPEIEAVKLTAEAVGKGLEAGEAVSAVGEARKKAEEAAAAAAALDALSDLVNGVLAQQNYIRAQSDKVIKQSLPNLASTPDAAARLVSHSDDDLHYIVTKVMKVKDPDAVGDDIVHMLNGLDKEMTAWRKHKAIEKKINDLPALMRPAMALSPDVIEKMGKDWDEEHEGE